MRDVNFIAAFPKSGITFLNYMLFSCLFEAGPDARRLIDRDYIIDLHEHLGRVPAPGAAPIYVKTHAPYTASAALADRAARAVYLYRDPIDVMMSVWDFKHLTDDGHLLDLSDEDHARAFSQFATDWVRTGGAEFPFAGTWVEHARSWLRQSEIAVLVVSYRRLKADPANELRRILGFLGRPVPDQRIAAAVAAGSVDRMRRDEDEEVAAGQDGAFYRAHLRRGYASGHRFVGRMHQDSYERVLDETGRRAADGVFGATLADLAAASLTP